MPTYQNFDAMTNCGFWPIVCLPVGPDELLFVSLAVSDEDGFVTRCRARTSGHERKLRQYPQGFRGSSWLSSAAVGVSAFWDVA